MKDGSEDDQPGLVTNEGVNERGTWREADGPEPSRPKGGDADDPDAPGSANTDDEHALAAAPEPNEPA